MRQGTLGIPGEFGFLKKNELFVGRVAMLGFAAELVGEVRLAPCLHAGCAEYMVPWQLLGRKWCLGSCRGGKLRGKDCARRQSVDTHGDGSRC